MSRTAALRRPPADDVPFSAAPHDLMQSAQVRDQILAAGQALRARHPWLRHQDAIGMGILAFALAGMGVCAWAHVSGHLSAWWCVPLVAIFASLTHELEHDLIHRMYFKQRPWAHRLMMVLVWLARPNTINPFIRRQLHLHHHKHSGTASDLEERAISNGVRWSLKRVVMLVDHPIGCLLHARAMRRADRLYQALQQPTTTAEHWALHLMPLLLYTPVGALYFLPWYAWVDWHVLQAALPWLHSTLGWHWQPSAMVVQAASVLDTYAVVYVLPNALRSFCLYFLSSNLHYYGDFDHRNVIRQCQVLNAWWLWPFQLFCFNFGSTHAIHHFAVKEPFYVRQWTAPTAHRVLREAGVRFNDFGTFRRANRWHEPARSAPAA